MTDLDERENDVDAILRASGLRLRVSMAHSPVAAFDRPRGPSRRNWMISTAAVVLLVVGLVAVGTNRNDRVSGNDPSRLHYLIARPPAGLNLVAVSEPGSQTGPPGETVMENVYATADAPLGPILSVRGSLGRPELDIIPAFGGKNFKETTIGGRRAAFADGETGARLLYIEADGRWVEMTSRNIDDAALSKMAQAVARAADGTAAVPAANLLDGLTLVLASDAPISEMNMGSNFSGISYATPDGRSVSLQVYSPTPSSRAVLGLQAALTETTVAGARGFVGSYSMQSSVPHTDVQILAWERDGLEFRVTGFNVDAADVLSAAESVEHAPDGSWTELIRQFGAGQESAEAAGTVPAESVPPDTEPVFRGEVHDVPIEVAVSDTSDNEQVWSGTLPTGESWKVDVHRVFDSISMQPEIDGMGQGATYGGFARAPGQEFGCCAPLNVITADANAASMRVTTNHGDRFTIPLHDLPGTGGLRIALVALPAGGWPELAELIDADGKVLQSFPPTNP